MYATATKHRQNLIQMKWTITSSVASCASHTDVPISMAVIVELLCEKLIKIKINFVASIFSSIITVIGLAKCTFGNIRLNTKISIYNFISIENIFKTKKNDTHDT